MRILGILNVVLGILGIGFLLGLSWGLGEGISSGVFLGELGGMGWLFRLGLRLRLGKLAALA